MNSSNNTSANGSNQLQIILNNWKKKITVADGADLLDPVVSEAVKKIEKDASQALELYAANAGDDALFLDHKPEKTTEMTYEFERIYRIAKSWASFGTKHYKDPQTLQILKHCIEWMYENRYGHKELNECGWRSPKIFNWWDWDIGSPSRLIGALICLGDEIKTDFNVSEKTITVKGSAIPENYYDDIITTIEKTLMDNNISIENTEDYIIYIEDENGDLIAIPWKS